MNSLASTLLPEPDGPAISTEQPAGTPPPSISSNPLTPIENRSRGVPFAPVPTGLDFSSGPTMTRGNTCTPSPVMRKVCSPGMGACPRIFMTCTLRHIEEGELLLIAQHLEGRFANDGEIERGSIGASEGEHNLLRECRLPGAGSAGNEIKGEL